jgi:hypothetical protein
VGSWRRSEAIVTADATVGMGACGVVATAIVAAVNVARAVFVMVVAVPAVAVAVVVVVVVVVAVDGGSRPMVQLLLELPSWVSRWGIQLLAWKDGAFKQRGISSAS